MRDDVISRKAAIDAAHKNYDGILDFRSDGETVAQSFEDILTELPSVQPERKHGTWKGYNGDNPDWQRNDGSPIFLTCSECCGTVFNNGSGHWNYCPNCGADMREGEQDD